MTTNPRLRPLQRRPPSGLPGPGPRRRLAQLPAMLLSALMALMALIDVERGMAEPERPSIQETVVMLYYRELSAAAAFYGGTLGLETVYRSDSALLYRLTPTSVVGVILEGDGAYHRAQDDNAVMLSIVTPDVDAWYEVLRDNDDVTVLKPLANSSNNPIRAFLVEDPGGYTVEFFSWLSAPP